MKQKIVKKEAGNVQYKVLKSIAIIKNTGTIVFVTPPSSISFAVTTPSSSAVAGTVTLPETTTAIQSTVVTVSTINPVATVVKSTIPAVVTRPQWHVPSQLK